MCEWVGEWSLVNVSRDPQNHKSQYAVSTQNALKMISRVFGRTPAHARGTGDGARDAAHYFNVQLLTSHRPARHRNIIVFATTVLSNASKRMNEELARV